MAVHDRWESTRACLDSLLVQQQGGVDFRLRVLVVDDGSSDETVEYDNWVIPGVVDVVRTDDDLFWARGMSLAQAKALNDDSVDYLLWLNNDVVLDPSAISSLLGTSRDWGPAAIVVGAMREVGGQGITYSGFRRLSRRPTNLIQVEPSGYSVAVDTFNGNCVLIPRAVADAVGAVDVGFSHGLGDWDYGFRAQRLGFPSVLVGTSIGECDRNPLIGSWMDASLSRGERLRRLLGRKGRPVRDTMRFNRRHGGPAWILFFCISYVRPAVLIAMGRPGNGSF